MDNDNFRILGNSTNISDLKSFPLRLTLQNVAMKKGRIISGPAPFFSSIAARMIGQLFTQNLWKDLKKQQ